MTKRKFIDKAELLEEVIKSKEQNKVTERLGELFLIMTKNYVYNKTRRADFSQYTYLEDMQASAIINLLQAVKEVDLEKYDNPFNYFTTVIHNQYLYVLNKEKDHRNIRDKAMMYAGYTPSFAFTDLERKIDFDGDEIRKEIDQE